MPTRVYSHPDVTSLYSTMVSVMFPAFPDCHPVPTTKWDYSAGLISPVIKTSRYPLRHNGGEVGLRFCRRLSSLTSEGGLLHVADHHVSPGKKQWSWGTGILAGLGIGNLTDENGPHIEADDSASSPITSPTLRGLRLMKGRCLCKISLPYSELGDGAKMPIHSWH